MDQGFEQGPIRPPSEAGSLLLRVTRNCPWNRCTFCPVYKGSRFSIRPVDQVRRDIDAVSFWVQALQRQGPELGTPVSPAGLASPEIAAHPDLKARQAALHWLRNGQRQVFLQDADSLIIKTDHLLEILRHLRERFPEVRRITSYARSATVAAMAEASLKALAAAGLNRIHIGLESGADAVLARVRKGATQEKHILAGLKVKQAGMELSEYYMPGLGGRDLLEANALETAAAINRINPDFIRLRTLAIPPGAPLYEEWRAGRFQKCTDAEMARELLLFLESLNGITGVVKSDHILNLLPEVEGNLPRHQERMIKAVRAFLALDREQQGLYQVGRRLMVFDGLADMQDPDKVDRVAEICRLHGISPDNVDGLADELMQRFI